MEAGVWTLVGGTVVGVVVAAGGILLAWLNNGGALLKQINTLQEQNFALQHDLSTAKAECLRETSRVMTLLLIEQLKVKDLEHDLQSATRRVSVLEAGAGISNTPAISGFLTTDMDGVIIDYSPSLTFTLGWTPDEMRGEKVERLVAPDMMEQHRERLAALKNPGVTSADFKTVISYAMDKSGHRVPVTVLYRKWPEPWSVIALTITPRPSASLVDGEVPRRRESDLPAAGVKREG